LKPTQLGFANRFFGKRDGFLWHNSRAASKISSRPQDATSYGANRLNPLRGRREAEMLPALCSENSLSGLSMLCS
jgi:hypothetical protein